MFPVKNVACEGLVSARTQESAQQTTLIPYHMDEFVFHAIAFTNKEWKFQVTPPAQQIAAVPVIINWHYFLWSRTELPYLDILMIYI